MADSFPPRCGTHYLGNVAKCLAKTPNTVLTPSTCSCLSIRIVIVVAECECVTSRPPPRFPFLQLGSWLGFTLMTQCLPVAFFTLVGFIQMTVWAKGKHRSYLKEFRDYPPLRSPILPFVL